jgi:hypothetical protein
MVAAGVDMALRDAVVSVCHIGEASIGSGGVNWLCIDDEIGFDCDIWSFVFAIWVRRRAKSFRRSDGGNVWISNFELSVKMGGGVGVGGFGGGVAILDCEGAAGGAVWCRCSDGGWACARLEDDREEGEILDLGR